MTFENPSDIVEFILEVATAGIKSSAIISRTSLSSVDLTEYLHVLLVHDLIAYRQIDKKYLTTTKGMSYLETYNDIRSQTVPNFAQ
ncbi:MAG: winged helix-turn-helix domain-containing protein [Nitrososphaeraceae archaeon]|jgi:predicted transcriptional regulator